MNRSIKKFDNNSIVFRDCKTTKFWFSVSNYQIFSCLSEPTIEAKFVYINYGRETVALLAVQFLTSTATLPPSPLCIPIPFVGQLSKMPELTREQQRLDAVSRAISRVLTPVMICMALSVWFVHSLGDPDKCAIRQDYQSFGESATTSDSTSGSQSMSSTMAIAFIVIFLVLMVAFTFLVVWLYKTGRVTYIKYWLYAAVFVVFGYVGGLYTYDFCRSRCVNIDWITLVLAIWNFAATGLVAVFGRAPRLINQAYLIVMSALMAYVFRSLPDFAVWIILALLVLWDLFAVLSPWGPLGMLVKIARERGDELPALVYDTNPVSAGREPLSTTARATPLVRKDDSELPAYSKQNSRSRTVADRNHTSATGHSPAIGPSDPTTSPGRPPLDGHSNYPQSGQVESTAITSPPTSPPTQLDHTVTRANERSDVVVVGADAASGRAEDDPEFAQQSQTSPLETSHRGRFKLRRGRKNKKEDSDTKASAASAETEAQVGTLGTHLKLGLGDFVFYSILVAQASKSGTMTAVASYVAILAGLCVTLFLVTVCKKALPALPISITSGLITYFLIRYTVLPFVNNLLPELLFY